MNETQTQQPIRVLIIDDHPMVREGTRALLDRSPAIEVMDALGDGSAALWLVRRRQPDVVLLDVRLPDISGIEVARRLRLEFPSIKVLVVTGYDEIGYARALLRLGVRGYLAKSASGAELVAAIRAVAAGNRVLTAEAARAVVDDGTTPLTAREHEVLHRLVAGMRNAEIADALCLSLKTVEFHVRNVFQKLGARSRAEAVSMALQRGLCLPGGPPQMEA